MQYLRIATSKLAELIGIQKPFHLLQWYMFHVAIVFIYIKRGHFFFALFFSDTL